LSDARLLTQRRRDIIEKDVAEALEYRLKLRERFLRTIEISEPGSSRDPDSFPSPWTHMEKLLVAINGSHSLGKPVPEAFSTKIQRKLASTMPPRPIVQLSFEQAHTHFKRLVLDGKEVTDVFNYMDSQSLLVSS
jgi:hypothetical protein